MLCSVVVGARVTIVSRIVVSTGNRSMIGCSWLASVLLSLCNMIVLGAYLLVVLSNFVLLLLLIKVKLLILFVAGVLIVTF